MSRTRSVIARPQAIRPSNLQRQVGGGPAMPHDCQPSSPSLLRPYHKPHAAWNHVSTPHPLHTTSSTHQTHHKSRTWPHATITSMWLGFECCVRGKSSWSCPQKTHAPHLRTHLRCIPPSFSLPSPFAQSQAEATHGFSPFVHR